MVVNVVGVDVGGSLHMCSDFNIIKPIVYCFFFQAEDGIRDLVRSRGLGDVYKRQAWTERARLNRRHRSTRPLKAPIPLDSCRMRQPIVQSSG